MVITLIIYVFESSVNSEGIETFPTSELCAYSFESSVNSEGIETSKNIIMCAICLRAV